MFVKNKIKLKAFVLKKKKKKTLGFIEKPKKALNPPDKCI